MTAAKALTHRHSSSFDQLTLAQFLTLRAYDRQVRHSRLAFRRRRDHLVAAVRRQVPQARVTGVAAGLHALLELPPGQDEDEIIARAAAVTTWPSTGCGRPRRVRSASARAGHRVRHPA